MNDLPHLTARAVMSEPKFSSANVHWSIKPNQANILLATFQPEDATGAFLPGLSVQLEVKRAIVADRCTYELGLFKLEGRVRRRVYQLAVTPADKRSHNGASGPLYGPHEHVGDLARPVTNGQIRCGNLQAAFAFFCDRISLKFTGTENLPI